MLSRVFKIDVPKCDCCGDLRPLCAVQDPDQIRKYLKHVNIEYDLRHEVAKGAVLMHQQRGPPIPLGELMGLNKEQP